MARRQKARPQCLRPYPRGVRGKTESADRGDESGDCGGAATDGFGRRRWTANRGKEGQAGEENVKTGEDKEHNTLDACTQECMHQAYSK